MEAGGDANIVLVDSLSVESAEEEDDSNKTRIFILGDSTVKYYGDDNTIGGWGEYLSLIHIYKSFKDRCCTSYKKRKNFSAT